MIPALILGTRDIPVGKVSEPKNPPEFIAIMNNALSPDRMTAAERLDEVAGILAAGIRRLQARETPNEINELGDFHLDFSATKSVHGPQEKLREGGSRT